MSCVLCYSNTHVSHNCDRFVSNESRQKIAVLRNRCQHCFDLKCIAPNRLECESKLKCYICFCKAHHTIYCPDRFTKSTIYPPNIDEDLLSRFMKFLEADEKCSFVLSYPNFCNSVKPLKVIQRQHFYSFKFEYLPEFDIFVADRAYFHDDFSTKLSDYRNLVFYLTHVVVNCTNWPKEFLFHFLTSKTKILQLKCKSSCPEVTFREILLKCPKLEHIDLRQSTIEVGNSWPDDLLQLNRAEKLQCLYLPTSSLDFNIQSVVTLLKSKSAKIFVIVDSSSITKLSASQELDLQAILTKYPHRIGNESQPFLSIIFKNAIKNPFKVFTSRR